MNKLFFRILVLLMSLSLIGIILVQVYWFNSSFKNNDEQFKFHVKQVMGDVSNKLQKQEAYKFYDKYNHYKDSTGKVPQKNDLLEFYYIQKNNINGTSVIVPKKNLKNTVSHTGRLKLTYFATTSFNELIIRLIINHTAPL